MKVTDFLEDFTKRYKYLTAIFIALGMKIALLVNLIYSFLCALFAFHWLHVVMFIFTSLLIILLRFVARYAMKKNFDIEVTFNDSSNLQKEK